MLDEKMGIVEEAARPVRSKRADPGSVMGVYHRLPPSDSIVLSFGPESLKCQSRGRLRGAQKTIAYFPASPQNGRVM